MSERTPQQDIDRATLAAALLRDPLLAEAFDMLEADILATWEATPVRDNEGREELWRLYKTAKKFRGIFHGYVEAGKYAEVQLREKQNMAQRVRQIFN